MDNIDKIMRNEHDTENLLTNMEKKQLDMFVQFVNKIGEKYIDRPMYFQSKHHGYTDGEDRLKADLEYEMNGDPGQYMHNNKEDVMWAALEYTRVNPLISDDKLLTSALQLINATVDHNNEDDIEAAKDSVMYLYYSTKAAGDIDRFKEALTSARTTVIGTKGSRSGFVDEVRKVNEKRYVPLFIEYVLRKQDDGENGPFLQYYLYNYENGKNVSSYYEWVAQQTRPISNIKAVTVYVTTKIKKKVRAFFSMDSLIKEKDEVLEKRYDVRKKVYKC